jgi:ribosome-binding ATPase YchF (GTP1/OBG family)
LAITTDLNDDEKLHLKDLHLLTNKQFVYVANVCEEMMDL